MIYKIKGQSLNLVNNVANKDSNSLLLVPLTVSKLNTIIILHYYM